MGPSPPAPKPALPFPNVFALAAQSVASGLPAGPLGQVRFGRLAGSGRGAIHIINHAGRSWCRSGTVGRTFDAVQLEDIAGASLCSQCCGTPPATRDVPLDWQHLPAWVKDRARDLISPVLALANIAAAASLIDTSDPTQASRARRTADRALGELDRFSFPAPMRDTLALRLGELTISATTTASARVAATDIAWCAAQAAVTDVFRPAAVALNTVLGTAGVDPEVLLGADNADTGHTECVSVNGTVEDVTAAVCATTPPDLLETDDRSSVREGPMPVLATVQLPGREASVTEVVEATLRRRDELATSEVRYLLVIGADAPDIDGDPTVDSMICSYGATWPAQDGRAHLVISAPEAVLRWLRLRRSDTEPLVPDDPEVIATFFALWEGAAGNMEGDAAAQLAVDICA